MAEASVKLNVRIEPTLREQAALAAKADEVTLQAWVIDALHARLRKRRARKEK